jgi:hypothetical protein
MLPKLGGLGLAMPHAMLGRFGSRWTRVHISNAIDIDPVTMRTYGFEDPFYALSLS